MMGIAAIAVELLQAFSQSGVDEGEIKRVEAVILSMTEQERMRPDIIEASRKRRIARGSGTDVSMVNQLLRQFQQLKGVMKMMGGGGGGLFGKLLGGGGGPAGGLPGMPDLASKQDVIAKMRRQGNLVGTSVDRAAQRKKQKQQKKARKRNRKRR